MNRNCLDPIFTRGDWSLSTMKNLRCLNFGVNKLIKQSRAARNLCDLMSYPHFRVNAHFVVV